VALPPATLGARCAFRGRTSCAGGRARSHRRGRALAALEEAVAAQGAPAPSSPVRLPARGAPLRRSSASALSAAARSPLSGSPCSACFAGMAPCRPGPGPRACGAGLRQPGGRRGRGRGRLAALRQARARRRHPGGGSARRPLGVAATVAAVTLLGRSARRALARRRRWVGPCAARSTARRWGRSCCPASRAALLQELRPPHPRRRPERRQPAQAEAGEPPRPRCSRRRSRTCSAASAIPVIVDCGAGQGLPRLHPLRGRGGAGREGHARRHRVAPELRPGLRGARRPARLRPDALPRRGRRHRPGPGARPPRHRPPRLRHGHRRRHRCCARAPRRRPRARSCPAARPRWRASSPTGTGADPALGRAAPPRLAPARARLPPHERDPRARARGARLPGHRDRARGLGALPQERAHPRDARPAGSRARRATGSSALLRAAGVRPKLVREPSARGRSARLASAPAPTPARPRCENVVTAPMASLSFPGSWGYSCPACPFAPAVRAHPRRGRSSSPSPALQGGRRCPGSARRRPSPWPRSRSATSPVELRAPGRPAPALPGRRGRRRRSATSTRCWSDRGDRVKKGQLLAVVRPSDLPDQMEAARVAFELAKANKAPGRGARARPAWSRSRSCRTPRAAYAAAQANLPAGSRRASARPASTRPSTAWSPSAASTPAPWSVRTPAPAPILTVQRNDVLGSSCPVNEQDAASGPRRPGGRRRVRRPARQALHGKVVRLSPAFDPVTAHRGRRGPPP